MSNGTSSRRFVTFLALGFAIAPAVHAAPEQPDNTPVRAIQACRTITASDQRLACFDKAAAMLDSAITNKDITVLDRQEVRKTRRSLFGFEVPHIALFDSKGDKDPKSADMNELDSTITGLHSLGYGKFEIIIADGGAVWRNTDVIDFPPRIGDKIHFKKGVMGNYFITIGSDQPIRGSRIR